MPTLSPEGRRIIEEIAARNDFSTDAAIRVLFAMSAGHGRQAQFNHAELGGPGQWSKGGTLMIGDMFNHELKARVGRLCDDLANALATDDALGTMSPNSQSQTQSSGRSAGTHLFDNDATEGRWPDNLGQPSSIGSQNDLHYAVFPGTRRLAVERGGQVTVYDTGDHRIGGASQQQSGDQSLIFTSQHGRVDLTELPIVSGPANQSDHHSSPSAKIAESGAASPGSDDVLSKLEKLADLRDKGIVTADEFDAKKAELMARI